MKPRVGLVLSLTGILMTGAAALAANTYTLNSTHPPTLRNAGSVLLPGASSTATPAPALGPSSTTAIPQTTPTSEPPPLPPPANNESGTITGGTVTAQPGTAATQAGTTTGGSVPAQTGDDKGGLRGGGRGHGSDD